MNNTITLYSLEEFLKFLPDYDHFVFDDQYENFVESKNVMRDIEDVELIKKETGSYLNHQLSKPFVKSLMERFNYLDNLNNGLVRLSAEGIQAKTLTHTAYQERLQVISDGEWYKSKLAQKQFNDHPKLVRRANLAIGISIAGIALSGLLLWIKLKCQ